MPLDYRITVTPWRDVEELLRVRRWIYPDLVVRDACTKWLERTDRRYDGRDDGDDDIRDEIERNIDGHDEIRFNKLNAGDYISAWKTRGPIPHLVESTWLFVEAQLLDSCEDNEDEHVKDFAEFEETEERGTDDPSQRPRNTRQPRQSSSRSTHHNDMTSLVLKAQYILALTRFVTAVLDAAQTSRYKVSMYTKADEIGLPIHLVDLRHEATHGEMPNLKILRAAARESLLWIWRKYWSLLGPDEILMRKMEMEMALQTISSKIRIPSSTLDTRHCTNGHLSSTSDGLDESINVDADINADGNVNLIQPWSVYPGQWTCTAFGT